jgi:hypothetical protein
MWKPQPVLLRCMIVRASDHMLAEVVALTVPLLGLPEMYLSSLPFLLSHCGQSFSVKRTPSLLRTSPISKGNVEICSHP